MEDNPMVNLYDLAVVHGIAKKQLHDFWHTSVFRKLLIRNLESKMPILDPPSEDFPRLRSYRGSGPHVELLSFVIHSIEPVSLLNLSIHYVESSIDMWMESEGCPGAEIQDVREYLYVPNELVKNTTQAAFDKWIKEFNQARFDNERKEALATIKKLQTKYKIGKGEIE